MIFVNYGGGGYYFFNHSTWNGLTVADLLFPWFVWIMGVTVGVTFKPPSSISSRTSKFFNVLQRSVKLFCLGLLLNSTGTDGDLANLRIPGVLQYFAVSYLYLNILALLIDSPSASRPRLFLGYGLGGLALLFMYCVLTYAVPVPDCPMGYLGAGGTFDGAEHPLCTGGSHRYIDEKILTSSHYYSDPTCKGVYGCLPYDPEGIVGAFNAAFLSFLGFATGKIVRAIPTNPTGEDQSIFLRYNAILGVLLMTVGAVLCNFSENNGIVPVNKNLWSPSFIFICGGFANILFGLFYVLLDMRRSSASIPQNSKFTDPSFLASDDSPSTPLWDGWPLRSVGKNSITLYMGHEILDGAVPFAMFFTEKGRDEHWGVVGR
jgi:heparan-alpha-glucosaminide N-acetyltransferase